MIKYFGVNLKEKADGMKLTKENYITNQILRDGSYTCVTDEPKLTKAFRDSLLITSYNDSVIKINNLKDDALYNFDLNMEYFNTLSTNDFNYYLNMFMNNEFIEIKDLNDCKINGLYIMVFDNYKQVYMGRSKNIKNRIMNHWSNQKELDLLVFYHKYFSVLSVDSFRAFDTTRIYIFPLDEYEHSNNIDFQNFGESRLIESFTDKKYLLNRISGGDPREGVELYLRDFIERKSSLSEYVYRFIFNKEKFDFNAFKTIEDFEVFKKEQEKIINGEINEILEKAYLGNVITITNKIDEIIVREKIKEYNQLLS